MKLRIGLGILALTAAVAVAAVRLEVLQGTAPSGRRAAPAPELTGIAGWVNGGPATLASLRGRVVLLDFWAYSCVNCVRTFPFLRALHARYHPFGLEIVGVHSPEFAFERDARNVRAAVARHRLPYPIALDDDMATWRAYRNNYWPRVYLIDASGMIRYDHIGEGGEAEIEAHVRALLGERGGSVPEALDVAISRATPHITPEIYAGHERGGPQGSLASSEGYRPGEVVDYRPVDDAAFAEAGTAGAFFLEGAWRADREYVEAAEDGARVRLQFRARDVFMVASGRARARVLLDGGPETSGDHARGGSVIVDRPDLFNVVRLEEVGTHGLTLIVEQGFRLYTFTFG